MRKKIKIIGLNLKTTTMNIPVTFLYFYMYKYTYIFEKIVKSLSCVRLFPTPWTVAYQAPRSMGFSRHDTGVGCHFLLRQIFLT